MKRFALSDMQAQAILDLRLQRLTNMELRLIQEEYESVRRLIEELRAILGSDRKLMNLIKKELLEIRRELAFPRRTQLIKADAEIAVEAEDLTVVEDVTIVICEGLKVRRCPSRLFSAAQIAEDRPLFLFETQSNKHIRLFTDGGALLMLPVSSIPETRQTARPANLAALLPFEKDEQIAAAFDESDEGDYLFYTRRGMVKRTPKADYRLRVKRTQAIALKDADKLVGVQADRGEDILMISESGMSIRFGAESVPSMGRVSAGVRGMKLDEGDALLFASQVTDKAEILLVSDKGFGKRCLLMDFDPQGRNGKGVKAFEFKKNGANGTKLAVALYVCAPHEFTLVQRHGAKTRLSTESVRVEPRAGGKGSMLVAVVLDDDVIGVEA